MSRLLEINALEANAKGVFSHPDSAERDFAYSDGSDAERYLFDVLSSTDDLGSASEALQLKIHDWPSEYHLSSRRANLLRPLPLEAGSRVLELGCGCGTISRYLGEIGCDVDAVEGSAVRAELARMRCRELDNVRVVQANFNRLLLPESEYDYVLLIGVVEYARRFSPDSDSDRGAVIDLLHRARAALKPGGRVLIAIENRTGMKYLHGAHEDHYSLRFVGIDDYREPAGIRTFTRREWRAIAADSGFDHHAFLYPFPDYKIPTVYLGENYSQRDPNAWCQLELIESADYRFLFDPYIPETLTWQGYCAAGVLGDMANSFMVVLSQSDNLGAFTDIDFVHLPSFGRRREFSTVITKHRSQEQVYRHSFMTYQSGQATGEAGGEPYFPGVLLCALWARAIMIHTDPTRFHEYLDAYLSFINRHAKSNPLPIDLLPNNIVVDESGTYQVFDQEWSGDGVDSDYLFFRATLTFANHYRAAIRQFARRYELHDVAAFIRHCFRAVNRGDRMPEEFCEREDAFQNQVLLERVCDTAGFLTTPIKDSAVNAHIHSRLYWSTGDGFTDERAISLALVPTDESMTLGFDLPERITYFDAVRFHPCDFHRPFDSGFFNVEAIRLIALENDHSTVLWSLDGEEIVLHKASLSQISVIQVDHERLLAVNGNEPAVTFAPGLDLTMHANASLRVEVMVRFSPSREYQLARQDFLTKEAALRNQVDALTVRLERARDAAQRAEADLQRIRTSRSWRLLNAVRRRLP